MSCVRAFVCTTRIAAVIAALAAASLPAQAYIDGIPAASAGTIQGHVTGAQGKPINGAHVTVPGTTFAALTNAEGAYSIAGIPAGSVQVRAAYPGYLPKVVDGFRVLDGQTSTLDFVLNGAETTLTRVSDLSTGLSLRFQLITSTATPHTDPSIADVDSVLKDLFKFPGYRRLATAEMAVDWGPPRPGVPTISSASQLLNGDGETYSLDLQVDSATSQSVRLHVWLYQGQPPTRSANPGGGTAMSPDRKTILTTTVTVYYGHTIVLGSTQPGGQGPASDQTLFLTVQPQRRRP